MGGVVSRGARLFILLHLFINEWNDLSEVAPIPSLEVITAIDLNFVRLEPKKVSYNSSFSLLASFLRV